MPKRIMLLVFASLVATIPMTIRSADAAPAPEDCVGAPDHAPPEGSHWYYRVDGENYRKCWYLGPQGAKVRHAAATKPERIAKPDPAPLARPVAVPQVAQIQPAPAASNPAEAPAVRWPDPPTPVVMPDREPIVLGEPGAVARPMIGTNADEADATETIAMPSPQPAAAGRAAVDAPPVYAVDWKLLLALLASALVVAAIIGRVIFRQPAAPRRRRPDFLDRPDAAWTAPRASGRMAPAFADADLRHFREVSVAPEADAAPIPRHVESNRQPSWPGDAGDEIEDLLRRLER